MVKKNVPDSGTSICAESVGSWYLLSNLVPYFLALVTDMLYTIWLSVCCEDSLNRGPRLEPLDVVLKSISCLKPL